VVTEATLRGVLDEVIHPSFGLSLLALGMIDAVRIEAGSVEVDLVMDCPGCPAAEAVLALAGKRLRMLGGVQAVRLSVLPKAWRPPWQG
jgi:metal-sulfur cluster biosynthetic enzyme